MSLRRSIGFAAVRHGEIDVAHGVAEFHYGRKTPIPPVNTSSLFRFAPKGSPIQKRLQPVGADQARTDFFEILIFVDRKLAMAPAG